MGVAIKVKVCELLIIRQKNENTHFVRTIRYTENLSE